MVYNWYHQTLSFRYVPARNSPRLGPKGSPWQLHLFAERAYPCIRYTGVYRKPTHTGVFLNFKAIVPFKWKFGVIYNLIQRAYKICSSPLHFNVEISKLRSIFSSNGYPKTFFDKVLTKFNESISGPRISNVDDIPRNFLYTFKMPFLGRPSVFLKKELSKLIKGKFGVDLNVAYTSCKIGDFFFHSKV